MKLLFEDSEPERAMRTDCASVQTILYRDATTIGRHINAAAGAAKRNAQVLTLDEIAYIDKHLGVSKVQPRKTTMRTGSSITTLSMGGTKLPDPGRGKVSQ